MSPKSDDWKDEAYKAYVARLAAHEATESERRRVAEEIAIWLRSAPDDAPTFTKEHQVELRAILSVFREKGIELDAPFMALDSVDAVSGYTGQLIISLAQVASPVLTAALVAWLKGRPGRKVRVEFHPSGTIKTVEAQTEEQVLAIAKALDHEARARVTKTKTE